jgi:hypothetical protein
MCRVRFLFELVNAPDFFFYCIFSRFRKTSGWVENIQPLSAKTEKPHRGGFAKWDMELPTRLKSVKILNLRISDL